MSKAKMERRKTRALASPLELSRMDNPTTGKRGSKRLISEPLTATDKRLRAERLGGANVPARVIERMGGSTKNARTSLDDSGPKMRPTRKPRTMGSEAAAAGLIGRDYGSKADGIKRVSAERIRKNRAEYFARAEKSRNARAAAIVATPVRPVVSEADRARADYAHAVGEANKRRAAGDESGYSAWMSEARKYRRIFRNK